MALRHPNLAMVHGICWDTPNGVPVLVTEDPLFGSILDLVSNATVVRDPCLSMHPNCSSQLNALCFSSERL